MVELELITKSTENEDSKQMIYDKVIQKSW